MPRKRTPSPEQMQQDQEIVQGAAIILGAVANRHQNEKLRLASELADSFVHAPTAAAKPRTRKPKTPPAPAPTSNVFVADGAHAEV